MTFYKDGIEIVRGQRIGKTYTINFEILPTKSASCAAATIEEWHQRFGHVSIDIVKRMQIDQAVLGLDIRPNKAETCEECALNKCHSASHHTCTTPRASKPGTVLHFYMAGPAKPLGVGNARLILIGKDEFSGFRPISCIRSKFEIPEEVKMWISRAEIETGNNVLQLCTDNGNEFLSQRLTNFLKERGIVYQQSTHHNKMVSLNEKSG